MAKLKAKLAKLPNQPGVYMFKDAKRQIIYVGKAAILKNRVRSYFQSLKRLDHKTRVMVGEIADLEWITCLSEIDALFLESELVKRYKPKYNIELRDDKHYLYVRITTKERIPTLSFTRRPLDDGAIYFGPYLEGFALRKALRYLRKIFPYNTHTVMPKRVCLQYHLGLCPGMEEGKTGLPDYRSDLRKLMMFLKGERTLLIKQLEAEMKQAAKLHEFEKAAQLRNQAHSLRALASQIVFGDQERFDISKDQALNGLSQLLELKGVPRRIEAYDISHIGGTANVASMVVFMEGVPAKGEYRKFKMIIGGNDDFAHMRETLTRRFSAKNLEKWPKPDLVVIDGGKGQLSAALEAMDELGISLPTIGLAKREETIILPQESETSNQQPAKNPNSKLIIHNSGNFRELKLPKDSLALQLLMRIRDEAHRFAVTYHSLLRSKKQTLSSLDEIPGIGPATRQKLIKHFGSLAGIKRASSEQLIAAIGRKKAATLQQQL